jgi:hypothetical protein
LGGLGAVALYMFVGLLFFVPGVILLSKEKAKKKDARNGTMVILAYVLMLIGCVVGLGLGSGMIFGSLMDGGE